MPVFDILIVEHPTKKQREDEDALERVVAGPLQVVARTPQGAAYKATREAAEKLKGANEDRIEVLVRPFA